MLHRTLAAINKTRVLRLCSLAAGAGDSNNGSFAFLGSR